SLLDADHSLFGLRWGTIIRSNRQEPSLVPDRIIAARDRRHHLDRWPPGVGLRHPAAGAETARPGLYPALRECLRKDRHPGAVGADHYRLLPGGLLVAG